MFSHITLNIVHGICTQRLPFAPLPKQEQKAASSEKKLKEPFKNVEKTRSIKMNQASFETKLNQNNRM